MLAHSVLFVSFFVVTLAYNFGPPCLPTRINFKVHYPCLESAEQDEYDDRIARSKGEPSAFARTGFYDRLFRCDVCIRREAKSH
ncbi:hypothetical protein OSTOST_08973 [Ostertagia ostertagi]